MIHCISVSAVVEVSLCRRGWCKRKPSGRMSNRSQIQLLVNNKPRTGYNMNTTGKRGLAVMIFELTLVEQRSAVGDKS